jgi:hypothetical protein
MNYSIGDFCASNTNAQTYHMDAEINLLVNRKLNLKIVDQF